MAWSEESIRVLPDIDLAYLAGDAANAQSWGMNPYGDFAVSIMLSECRKRGIDTIFTDSDQRLSVADLKEPKNEHIR